MNIVTNYLNTNFKTPDGLAAHFMENFGVTVKRDGDFFLFKYDMLAAKFLSPITRMCRGHIWHYSPDGWELACNPFDKFFNLSEGHCELFNKPLSPKHELWSKEDGTCVTAWFDFVKNEWHYSTLGTINTMGVNYSKTTVADMFLATVGDLTAKFDNIGRDYTFIFELCCNANRIVTSYKDNRAYLIGVRHNVDGHFLHTIFYANMLGLRAPRTVTLYNIGVNDEPELQRWVNANCQDDEDSKFKEGFVLYDGFRPVAKVKTDRYQTLHKFGGGDNGQARNAVIRAYFTGALDDVKAVFTDETKAFADGLEAKVREKVTKINTTISTAATMSFPTQKDYAVWVLGNVEKCFSGFFFQNKASIVDGSIGADAFSLWLRENWEKLEDIWKDR